MNFLKNFPSALISLKDGKINGIVEDSLNSIPFLSDFRSMAQDVAPERVIALKESFLSPDFNILSKENDDTLLRESVSAILRPIMGLMDKSMMMPFEKTHMLLDHDISKLLLALPDEVLANVLHASGNLLKGVGQFREGMVGSFESSVPAITGLLKDFSLNISNVVRDGLVFKTQLLPNHLFGILREIVEIADRVFQLEDVLGKLPIGFRPMQKDLLKLMKVFEGPNLLPRPLSMDVVDLTSVVENRENGLRSSLINVGNTSQDFDHGSLNEISLQQNPMNSSPIQGQLFFEKGTIKNLSPMTRGAKDTIFIPNMRIKDHVDSLVNFVDSFTSMLDDEGRKIFELGIEGERIVYQVAKFVLDDLVFQGTMDVQEAAMRLINVFGRQLYGMSREALNGVVPQMVTEMRSVQVVDGQVTEAMDRLMGLYKDYVDIMGLAAFSIEEFYSGKIDAMRNIVKAPKFI